MRDATVGALASVAALPIPAVAMAAPVGLFLTAIERDRIAYVAFAASLNGTYGPRQHRKKVAKSRKPMRTLTKPPAASGRMRAASLMRNCLTLWLANLPSSISWFAGEGPAVLGRTRTCPHRRWSTVVSGRSPNQDLPRSPFATMRSASSGNGRAAPKRRPSAPRASGRLRPATGE